MKVVALAAGVTFGVSAIAAAQEKPAGEPVPPRAARRPETRPASQPGPVPVSSIPQPPPPDGTYFQGRYAGPGGGQRVVPPEDVAQQVTCVIQIDADAAFNPYGGGSSVMDARTAASVIRSTPVLQAAVKQALGGTAPQGRLQDWLVVNSVQTGQRFLEVEITLLKGDPRNEADEGRAAKLLDALCDTLEAALRESVEGQREQAQKRRDKLEHELTAARQRLADVRSKLRKYRAETATVGQGGSDLRYAAQNLRSQRQNYEQQLAANRARLKAIEPSASPLVAEWRDVVDLRQKQLDELREQASAGKATAEQVAAQERRLADAKAQLETYRRSAAVENDSMRTRGSEVASLQANIANTEANLKPILEQLAKLEDPKVIEMAEEIPELQNEENRARNEVSELQTRADQLRRTSDAGGEIALRVLDGKPDDAPAAPK